jgi:hypothetical protein
MTLIDYLLVGGFAAASIYTVSRLFIGFRNSSTADARLESIEESNRAVAADNNRPAGSTTSAPWHRAK